MRQALFSFVMFSALISIALASGPYDEIMGKSDEAKESVRPKKKTAAKKKNKAQKAKANPLIKMKTNLGDVTIELFKDKVPKTVSNFLKYVDGGFYTGTIFHRVMSDFMIQGGGFTPQLDRKSTFKEIKLESHISPSNKRGTISMARTGSPDSATSQFFINVVDNTQLDFRSRMRGSEGYCVFGQVKSGMDIVDKIRSAQIRANGPFTHLPVRSVIIRSVKRL